jgi:oligosaccharide repeat unit polymerase
MSADTLQTFGAARTPQVFGPPAATVRTAREPRPARSAEPVHGAKGSRAAWLTLTASVTATAAFFAIYAVPDAMLFMSCSFALALACIGFVALHRPGETLVAAKVASLLYAASFSYAPLWLFDKGAFRVPYYGLDARPLMGETSLIILVGYLLFLAGYFLVLRLRRRPRWSPADVQPDAAERQRRFALMFAVPVTLIGAFCYVKLVAGSGGLMHLLNYTGGRADILSGTYGGWFWGAHVLFVAYGLVAVALMARHPWLCLALALSLAAVFVPLQGRDIVVGPVFCWLLFYHTLRKPVRWRTVAVGALAIVLIAAMLAAFRTGGNRLAMRDSGGFVSAFSANAGKHLTDVVSANIDQLDTAMIAVRYVELQDETIGPAALLSWFAPISRQFFSGTIPFIYTGVFMDLLVNPQHRGWNTALSPSLPGELYLSLGWSGVGVGLLLFGALFALFTVWSDRRELRPLLFAAYPFVVYMSAKMIVDGTTHAFRPMIVFLAALACALLVSSPATKPAAVDFHP